MNTGLSRFCRVSLLTAGALLGAVAILSAEGERAAGELGPTMGELFRARHFIVPQNVETVPDSAEKSLALFQRAGRIAEWELAEGEVLRFSFEKGRNRNVLHWGNTTGRMSEESAPDLWRDSFYVEIKVRQIGGEPSEWATYVSVAGKRERARLRRFQKLEPGKVETLRINRPGSTWGGAGKADGLHIIVRGGEGATFEIQDLRCVRRIHHGWFRKEVDLPAGKVWRANASPGYMTIVYVNGEKVPDRSVIRPRPTYRGAIMYWTHPIDLKPYLKPGQKNCIAVEGRREGQYPPNIYLQSRIVMEDGTSVTVDTDETWTWRLEEPDEGWVRVGQGQGFQPLSGVRKPKDGTPGLESHWYFQYKQNTERPASDGLLFLDNPADNGFYYSSTAPVTVRVRVPAGLAPTGPSVAWTVHRATWEGFEPVTDAGVHAAGETEQFTRKGDSLVFELDIGRCARGVYALSAELKYAGETVEKHVPEPFVVVGPLDQHEARGATYDDGMGCELEATIDCTKPDRHPWLEATGETAGGRGEKYGEIPKQPLPDPLIVRENGLVYRETREHWGAQFSYKVTFEHPFDWYMVEVDYPDDRERWMGVSCTSRWRGKTSYARLCPAVAAGFKFPVSGTMRTMRFLYRPGPGPHAVNVINMQRGSTAAAAEIRFFRVTKGLPALAGHRSGERFLGILTENLNPRNAFGAMVGIHRTPTPADRGEASRQTRATLDARPVGNICRTLLKRLDTSEAYVQYSRFTGENLNAMGAWQYHDYTPVLPGRPGVESDRVTEDLRAMAIRVLSANGIRSLPSVEFITQTTLREAPESGRSDPDVRDGADTYYLVDKDGVQIPNLNFLHPDVETMMLRVADEFAWALKDVPGVLGLNWTTYMGGNFSIPTLFPASRYNPRDLGAPFDWLAASYDDATIRRFAKDTGIDVPGTASDPERFGERYDFLTAQGMRDRWLAWRCEKLQAFFRAMRDRIRSHRKDYVLLASQYMDVPHATMWKASGLGFERFLKQAAWDASLFRDEEGLYVTQWMYGIPLRYRATRRLPGYACGWALMAEEEPYDVFASGLRRSQMIMHHWQEVERYPFVMPEREGWAYPYQSTPQAHAVGDWAREPFTLGLIGGDPQIVLWGFSHVSRMTGNEQAMREFIRVFRALPSKRFQPVLETGMDTDLAIRTLRTKEGLLFYVANPTYWAVEGTVTLSGAAEVADLVTGETVGARRNGEGVDVPVRLKPYGVVAFRVPADNARVTGYDAKPVSAGGLDHLRSLASLGPERLDSGEDLGEEDRHFLEQHGIMIDQALDAEQFARAWQLVTDWRYWMLAHGHAKW